MKILAVLLLIGSCGTSTHKETQGDEIKVKLNDSFEIKLETNLGLGFSWQLTDSVYQKNLSLDSTYTIPNPSGKENGPETQVFKFKGIAKGQASLHFIYIRPWRKNEKPDKEKTYQVTVE